MSTSGVSTFNITRDQLITGALRMLGVVAQGETPTNVQILEAAEALNMLVKAYEADGMPLWGIETYGITLVAGQSTYVIGTGQQVSIPKPLKVIQAWNKVLSSGVDIPMRILTKQEYNVLGNKTTTGNPIQLHYQPKLTYGELYVFPVPTSIEQAQNKVYIVYQRPFEDFLNSGDNPDFPQEWLDALKYGLAARLAPEYGVPSDQRMILIREAKEIKEQALSFGTEEGSLYFQYDRRGY